MPLYFNEDQYREILKPHKQELPILIPNEIFHELPRELDPNNQGTSSKHIAFAFSYVYLITYLYRYTKYGLIDKELKFTEQEIKKLLTVSPTSKGKDGINYIVKKGGVLEQLGYIKKGEEAPVRWEYYYHNDDDDLNNEVYFYFNSFLNMEILSKEQWIKVETCNLPLKLLEKRTEIEYELDEEGNEVKEKIVDEHILGEYFVRAKHTTGVDINTFIYCMSRGDLGVQAFYLYAFIKYKNGYYGGNWQRPLTGIAEDTGLKLHTIKRTLKAMEENNMIWSSHEVFVTGLSETGEQKQASEYKTLEPSNFYKQYKRSVKTREVISVKEWEQRKKVNSFIESIQNDKKE
ncbi:hypothetical protein [Priestia endophytica]|uniref:hypothetical protein n=1 Tax=Priestia endophytica TaxID=135735 RepID=UPI000F521D0C|nr:hypothetical protein [Priestia endophytica]RPK08305.1 hypothetical protein FH5_04935 [Priestia endophytica]